MHYQIHLNNIKLPMLVEADCMENIGNMLVLYKASSAVAAISIDELKCVIEVEASSVPPKEDFLDLQTDHQRLKVEHKALQLKNNELWEERRKAMDAEEAALDKLTEVERKMGMMSITYLLTLLAIAIVAIAKIYWS